MADLPPAYDPTQTEPQILDRWESAHAFHADASDGRPGYSIVIPPPNVTAALHLGHALNNTLQDILARRARMQGKATCWMPGTDHAGIATQTIVDKRLQAEGKPALKDYKKIELEGGDGRGQFLEKVGAWKDEYEKTITDQLKTMGCSCDWERQRFTMDPMCAKAVREAFFQLFKDGLIYRGKRLVNWDPVSQTALADDEVEMETIDGSFFYLKYPVCDAQGKETGETITVATTRPETMLGDTAVAVNPKDPVNSAFGGKFVKLPITGRVIPIIADEYVVIPDANSSDAKAKMSSGFLKVTPAHDPNDYALGQKYGLAMINVMAPDASISLDFGWKAIEPKQADNTELKAYLGLSREEARKAIIRHFRAANLLDGRYGKDGIAPYRHAVGHSYRSHVPVEPYLSDQWYVKVTDERLAGAALRAMAKEQRSEGTKCVWKEGDAFANSNVAPVWVFKNHAIVDNNTDERLRTHLEALARYKAQGRATITNVANDGELQHALIQVKDQADHEVVDTLHFLGFEKEVENEAGGAQLRFFPDRYAKNFQGWHENIRDWCISRQLWWGHRVPVWSMKNASEDALKLFPILDQKSEHISIVTDGDTTYVCVRQDELSNYFETRLQHFGFVQDPDVLDTWFSSALWPLSTFGWPENTPELQKWNPTDVLCTAREIITLWVSRMVMFNLYFRGTLPFKDVFIHAMIQDGNGQKMSKSLGNGVDPMDIIHSHGSDAMRFALAKMTTHTQDLRLPVDMVDPHTGESFTPAFVTVKGGYKVAAPIQERNGKKITSSYGAASGEAKPTDEAPLARNTSEKFDEGKRFANKMWNAFRFALANLEGKLVEGEFKPGLADQWILGRLDATLADCEKALGEYMFANYASALYDFFWRDLCDWYIESVKPTIQTNPTQQRILASCMDAALRLLHPVMPFVTERLWERLNEVVPFAYRGLPGLALPESNLLVNAAWPAPAGALGSADAVAQFEQLRAIVGALREMRTAAKLAPRDKKDASIKAPAAQAAFFSAHKALIETFTATNLVTISPDAARAKDAAAGVSAGCEIYLHGVLDLEVEKKRLTKAKADLEGKIKNYQTRLSNEKYVATAPPKLVQETRDGLATAESELAAVEAQIAAL